MSGNESTAIQGRSLTNFLRALQNLEQSVALPIQNHRDISGVIKDFEMAYELSWKVLKKVLREAGHETLGAKDVYTQAFQLGYLDAQEPWITMIQDRNQTAHVYDENDARGILARITSNHLPAFLALRAKLQSLPSNS